MAEINSAGYQDIRDRVEANWLYISLRDGSDVEIVRLPVSDSRVAWTHAPGAQTLELTTVVKGDDTDLAALLPKTFAKASLFKVATAGSALTEETFTSFTMSTAADQLTVVFKVEIPQVV